MTRTGKKEKQRILQDLNLSEEEYQNQRKTFSGCYELLKEMLKLPYINIYGSEVFSSVDDKFFRLLGKAENKGKDVGSYRQKYEKLFENYDDKRDSSILECSQDSEEEPDIGEPSDLELLLLEKSINKRNS